MCLKLAVCFSQGGLLQDCSAMSRQLALWEEWLGLNNQLHFQTMLTSQLSSATNQGLVDLFSSLSFVPARRLIISEQLPMEFNIRVIINNNLQNVLMLSDFILNMSCHEK